MVLRTIHDEMLTSKQERIHIQGKLTVEHVMPQSWREHWPAPAVEPAQDPNQPTPADRRDSLLHTFGNLTLLTQGLNSSISNGPFLAKRNEMMVHSLLRLSSYFHQLETWDEGTIVERGRLLFSHACALWPFPTATS